MTSIERRLRSSTSHEVCKTLLLFRTCRTHRTSLRLCASSIPSDHEPARPAGALGDRSVSAALRRGHSLSTSGGPKRRATIRRTKEDETMSLRTTLGMSGGSSLEEGEPHEVMEKKRRAYDEVLRPARLEVARAQRRLDGDRERPRAASRRPLARERERRTAIYQRVRGVVFASYSVNVIADQAELSSTSTTTATRTSSSGSPEPGRSTSRSGQRGSSPRPLRGLGSGGDERLRSPAVRPRLRRPDHRRREARTLRDGAAGASRRSGATGRSRLSSTTRTRARRRTSSGACAISSSGRT